MKIIDYCLPYKIAIQRPSVRLIFHVSSHKQTVIRSRTWNGDQRTEHSFKTSAAL